MSARPDLPMPRFRIGADGGGTGTRVRVVDAEGRLVGRGAAGPSGLGQGVEQAWRHVGQAVQAAFTEGGLAVPPPSDCALALSLAGAERSSKLQAFHAADPGYALCLVENDALGALRGAFTGRPGRVVASGTGSVGAARWPDGRLRLIGGWGFPIGDEGSGAWLGVRAMQHAQAALDGRAPTGALARALFQRCGATPPQLLDWSLASGQHAYAQLAPLVFELADADPQAEWLLQLARDELVALAQALQPDADDLPLVVTGSVGVRLRPRMPPHIQALIVEPAGDAIDGALQHAAEALAGRTATTP